MKPMFISVCFCPSGVYRQSEHPTDSHRDANRRRRVQQLPVLEGAAADTGRRPSEFTGESHGRRLLVLLLLTVSNTVSAALSGVGRGFELHRQTETDGHTDVICGG